MKEVNITSDRILFQFLGGGKAPTPPTMDKRLSAHPLSFCMYAVYVDPHYFISKTYVKAVKISSDSLFFLIF